MKNIIVFLMIIITVGCSAPETKKNTLQPKEQKTIYTIKQNNIILKLSTRTAYPGSWIHANIEYLNPIKQVLFGFLDVSIISKSQPKGNQWEDEVLVPSFEPSENILYFTVIDSNNASSQITAKIEVVAKPDVLIDLIPDSAIEQTVTVTGKEIKSVVFENNEGQKPLS